MVTDKQRKFILLMIKIKAFETDVWLRNVHVHAKPGFKCILKRIQAAQVVDDYHHAPACPANHFHKKRLVFQKCSCGAEAWEKQQKAIK